jgi:hypothetical protein
MKYTPETVILHEDEVFEPPIGAIGITIIKDYEVLIEESKQMITIGEVERPIFLESRVSIWKINYLIPVKDK